MEQHHRRGDQLRKRLGLGGGVAAAGEASPDLQARLLDIRKNAIGPASRLLHPTSQIGISRPTKTPAVGRQIALGCFVLQHPQAKLFEIVLALGPPRRLARLNRRQQQRDQNADDRDDHQQLNQGEAASRVLKKGSRSERRNAFLDSGAAVRCLSPVSTAVIGSIQSTTSGPPD